MGIYRLGSSIVNAIIHQVVQALKEVLLPKAIVFPRGVNLAHTMDKFRQISGLHCCAGAVDGTFMRIRKPREWGDHYW